MLKYQSFQVIHSPPKIVKQPPADEQLFTVSQGEQSDVPFTMECEAEGEPSPR